MKVLDIARKDMLRSLRSAFFLMFGLGMPLLMAGIFYFAFGGLGDEEAFNVPQTKVQVVNLDQPMAAYGDFSAGQMLVDFLKADDLADLVDVTETTDAAGARAAVDSQKASVAVIIPTDFSASVFDPEGQSAIEIYQDPTLTLGPGIVKSLVSRFVDTFAGAKIATGVAHNHLVEQSLPANATILQNVALKYADWSASQGESQGTGEALFAVKTPLGKAQENGDVTGPIGLIMGGMTIFYAFFTGASATLSILQEEEEGTLPRLFTTPTSHTSILGGKLIAVFAVILIQLTVLMTVSSLVFKIDWGAPLPLTLVSTTLIALAASFGIFITSLLRDTKQAGVIYGGVMTVMGMVGISSVFTANVPNVSPMVRTLPLIVPQGWAMRSLRLVMDGGGVSDVLTPILVALGLSVIFFLVGALNFKKRFA